MVFYIMTESQAIRIAQELARLSMATLLFSAIVPCDHVGQKIDRAGNFGSLLFRDQILGQDVRVIGRLHADSC